MTTIKSISIIGSGNVASHLGQALFNSGLIINDVYSRSMENASLLALKIGARPIDKLSELTTESDLHMVCVKDDAINKVLSQMDKQLFVVLTSGSIHMDIFQEFGFKNYGIFYPLQTFSKNKTIRLNEVPFCLEANSNENEQLLMNIAKQLSENVYFINSDQRKNIHLAAVFACNFSNYMYTIAANILEKNELSFDLLKPLILETAKKIQTVNPKDAQTGPAKRNDTLVLKNHLEMLEGMKEYQDMYKLISELLMRDV